MDIDFRKGDIVEYQIAGIKEGGFSGTGMVLDDNVIEVHIIDANRTTDCVIVKDLAWASLRHFGRCCVTNVVKCRENIKNFWEYL